MRPQVSMRRALEDPQLLGDALPGDSWRAWRVLLIALVGEALTPAEQRLFERLTRRSREPGRPVEEAWVVAGRRSGKTRASTTLACYLAGLCDHADVLARGERGLLPILSASVAQAARAYGHVLGVLAGSPVLRTLITSASPTAGIKLSNGIDIEPRAADFRTIRGATSVAVLCDELAFWAQEGAANPDKEVLNAVRPMLATTGGPLICISSPHARKGELYEAWREHYGPQGDPAILVVQAASRDLNPSLPEALLVRAYARDPSAAAAEYGGQFRDDIEAFIDEAGVLAVTDAGRTELAYDPSFTYSVFVDAAGGSKGGDSYAIAVSHLDGPRVVVDLAREFKPPFSFEVVCASVAAIARAYGVRKITGDRFAGFASREPFERVGIRYEIADRTASDLLRDLLPLINSRTVSLPDDTSLRAQLVALERRAGPSGREIISHPKGQHDDLAVAVAGAALLSVPRHRQPFLWYLGGPEGGRFISGQGVVPTPETKPAEHAPGSIAEAEAGFQRLRAAGAWGFRTGLGGLLTR